MKIPKVILDNSEHIIFCDEYYMKDTDYCRESICTNCVAGNTLQQHCIEVGSLAKKVFYNGGKNFYPLDSLKKYLKIKQIKQKLNEQHTN